jgi:hypothetical protein
LSNQQNSDSSHAHAADSEDDLDNYDARGSDDESDIPNQKKIKIDTFPSWQEHTDDEHAEDDASAHGAQRRAKRPFFLRKNLFFHFSFRVRTSLRRAGSVLTQFR